jgi:hypothetical protein
VPAASNPGINVTSSTREKLPANTTIKNGAVSGPTIAPHVSIIRSNPNARP